MTQGANEDTPSEAPEGPAKLVSGSIRGHLVSQTVPMIAGLAALMSVGIVDAYFIGELGSEQLAAVAFIFPVTQALSSLGVGVMVGIASVVSRELGRGDRDRARAISNLGFLLAAAIGIGIAIPLYLLRAPLFRLLQANETQLPLIDAYMAPFALGFALLPSMMGLNGALRALGAAKRSMAILLTMAVSNWIFDPILILGAFGFGGFGIAGAAYATIASWLISAAVGLWMLKTTDISFDPAAARQCHLVVDTRSLARVAGPAALSNSINPAGLAILTALLAATGPAAVAGFGAGGRIQSFAVVPMLALSSSIGAIVGQNWGAQLYDRVRSAIVQSGLFCLGYGLLVAIVIALLRDPVAALFSDDLAVKQALSDYLLIGVWGFAGFGVLIVVNGALNAVDRAGAALLQSAARVALVMAPVALVLRASLGADAIYIAELAANLAGGAAAIAIAMFVFRKPAKQD